MPSYYNMLLQFTRDVSCRLDVLVFDCVLFGVCSFILFNLLLLLNVNNHCFLFLVCAHRVGTRGGTLSGAQSNVVV